MDMMLQGQIIREEINRKARMHLSVQENSQPMRRSDRRYSNTDVPEELEKKHQFGVLSARATLDGLDAMNRFRNGFLSGTWSFRIDVSPAVVKLLHGYTNSDTQTLIKTLKAAGYFDGRVSDTMNDIRSVTSGDFKIDEASIQRLSTNGNALFCHTNINIQLQQSCWGHLGRNFEGGESRLRFTLPRSKPKENTLFASLYETLMRSTFDASRSIILCRDHWGHAVGAYTIPFDDGLTLEISVTDLKSFPQDSQLVRPSPEEIVNSHINRTGWQDMTEIDGYPVRGFDMKPFRVPIDNSALDPLLGATRESRQIVGVQTQGYLQVNKETPCNFKMESLVVEVTRGGGSSCCQEGYYQFYHKSQDRWGVFFHNLVQVKINGQLVFYTTCTEDDADR